MKTIEPLKDICSVTLVLTSGCNLTCSYCFQNAKSGRRMSWATLQQAVDILLASNEDEVELIFYGGEPLIQFDLIRRAVGYVEASRRSDQQVDYSTISNGTLIGEAEAKFLACHDFKLQLSIDGVPSVQALRGAETFDVLDALLDRLRMDHSDWFQSKISVSATVLPSTVHHLADSVSYFLDKGIGSIGFSPGSTDTSRWQPEQIHELDEQFERIFQMSLRRYRRTGQVPVEWLRNSESRRPLVQAHAMCNVETAEELTVDVNGRVYGCVMFTESFQEFPSEFLQTRMSRMRLGRLSQPELADRMAAFPEAVAQAEIFHRHDQKYSSYGECGACKFLDSCFICPVSIGQIPFNTDPRRIPDFLCAFSLVSNKYRELLAAEPRFLDWLRDISDRSRSDGLAALSNDELSGTAT